MTKYLLFLIGSIVSFLYAPSYMEKEYMTIGVVFSLFFTINFLMTNRKNCRMGFFRHSNIFIVVFLIVFYQFYIDYILGFIDSSEIMIWINTSVVPKSLGMCNIAVSSFLLGYKFQSVKHVPISKKYTVSQRTLFPEKKILCNIGYFMLAYFIITADDSFFRSGYLTSEGQLDASFGVMVLLQSVIIAVFSFYCIEYKNYYNGVSIMKYFKTPGFLVVLYAIVVILSGRRTEALRVVVMLLFAYIYILGNKLNVKKTLSYLFIGVILTSVYGAIRGEGQSFSQGVKILTENNTISPFTKELAGSVNTVHIAMENVPNIIPYNNGVTFLASFALLIPGLDRVISLFLPNDFVLNSSTQISNMYWGGSDWGYGMGSSMIADVYISFGVIGILVVFLLIGILFHKLEEITTNSNNIYMFAMCIGVYSQILYACRTGVGVLFLSWTYACIFIYLSKKIFHK